MCSKCGHPESTHQIRYVHNVVVDYTCWDCFDSTDREQIRTTFHKFNG